MIKFNKQFKSPLVIAEEQSLIITAVSYLLENISLY